MTREEALKLLKTDRLSSCEAEADRFCEAYDMAIRALENHNEFMKRAYDQGKQDALSQEPMREFTKEEAEAYSKALDKMYKPTGFNVFDDPIEVEEIDFVQEHKKIPVTLDLTPCEDAISREDRLIDLANAIESDDSGYWTNERISSALRNISSVTQKSGKWVLNVHDIPICSQCGYMTPYDRAIDDYEYGNYCPNCGAKMESEDKE